MKRGAFCVAVSVALALTQASAPDSAGAQGVRGNNAVASPPSPAHPIAPRPVAPRPVVPRPGGLRPYIHRPYWPAVVTVPVYVPSPSLPASPYGYDPSLAYDPTTFYSPQTDMVSLTPPPSPPPSVIEYPTGRYELRGGGGTPYSWVWIPNPPPPPPVPPAPPARAEAPTPPGPSAESAEVFRYTDDQGVVTWTDRWDSIPERYRSRAKRLPL
jgi:hypothetical protein